MCRELRSFFCPTLKHVLLLFLHPAVFCITLTCATDISSVIFLSKLPAEWCFCCNPLILRHGLLSEQESSLNVEAVEQTYRRNPILRYTQHPLHSPLLPLPYGDVSIHCKCWEPLMLEKPNRFFSIKTAFACLFITNDMFSKLLQVKTATLWHFFLRFSEIPQVSPQKIEDKPTIWDYLTCKISSLPSSAKGKGLHQPAGWGCEDLQLSAGDGGGFRPCPDHPRNPPDLSRPEVTKRRGLLPADQTDQSRPTPQQSCQPCPLAPLNVHELHLLTQQRHPTLPQVSSQKVHSPFWRVGTFILNSSTQHCEWGLLGSQRYRSWGVFSGFGSCSLVPRLKCLPIS